MNQPIREINEQLRRDAAGLIRQADAAYDAHLEAIADDIRARLAFRPGNVTHTLSFDRSNLSYIIRNSPDKLAKVVQVLGNTTGTAIIYVRSRARTQEIAQRLTAIGIDATFYHAGLDARLRSERQQQGKEGTIRRPDVPAAMASPPLPSWR